MADDYEADFDDAPISYEPRSGHAQKTTTFAADVQEIRSSDAVTKFMQDPASELARDTRTSASNGTPVQVKRSPVRSGIRPGNTAPGVPAGEGRKGTVPGKARQHQAPSPAGTRGMPGKSPSSSKPSPPYSPLSPASSVLEYSPQRSGRPVPNTASLPAPSSGPASGFQLLAVLESVIPREDRAGVSAPVSLGSAGAGAAAGAGGVGMALQPAAAAAHAANELHALLRDATAKEREWSRKAAQWADREKEMKEGFALSREQSSALLAAKEKAMKAALRKYEGARSEIEGLKDQLAAAYAGDRLVELENAKREKEILLLRLAEENKGLAGLNRTLAKKLDEAEVAMTRGGMPAKLDALVGELRTERERSKKLKIELGQANDALRKSHDTIIGLTDGQREQKTKVDALSRTLAAVAGHAALAHTLSGGAYAEAPPSEAGAGMGVGGGPPRRPTDRRQDRDREDAGSVKSNKSGRTLGGRSVGRSVSTGTGRAAAAKPRMGAGPGSVTSAARGSASNYARSVTGSTSAASASRSGSRATGPSTPTASRGKLPTGGAKSGPSAGKGTVQEAAEKRALLAKIAALEATLKGEGSTMTPGHPGLGGTVTAAPADLLGQVAVLRSELGAAQRAAMVADDRAHAMESTVGRLQRTLKDMGVSVRVTYPEQGSLSSREEREDEEAKRSWASRQGVQTLVIPSPAVATAAAAVTSVWLSQEQQQQTEHAHDHGISIHAAPAPPQAAIAGHYHDAAGGIGVAPFSSTLSSSFAKPIPPSLQSPGFGLPQHDAAAALNRSRPVSTASGSLLGAASVLTAHTQAGTHFTPHPALSGSVGRQAGTVPTDLNPTHYPVGSPPAQGQGMYPASRLYQGPVGVSTSMPTMGPAGSLYGGLIGSSGSGGGVGSTPIGAPGSLLTMGSMSLYGQGGTTGRPIGSAGPLLSTAGGGSGSSYIPLSAPSPVTASLIPAFTFSYAPPGTGLAGAYSARVASATVNTSEATPASGLQAPAPVPVPSSLLPLSAPAQAGEDAYEADFEDGGALTGRVLTEHEAAPAPVPAAVLMPHAGAGTTSLRPNKGFDPLLDDEEDGHNQSGATGTGGRAVNSSAGADFLGTVLGPRNVLTSGDVTSEPKAGTVPDIAEDEDSDGGGYMPSGISSEAVSKANAFATPSFAQSKSKKPADLF